MFVFIWPDRGKIIYHIRKAVLDKQYSMHCYLPLNLNTRARNYSKHIADKPKEQQLKFTIA